jgi:hypothetical protein
MCVGRGLPHPIHLYFPWKTAVWGMCVCIYGRMHVCKHVCMHLCILHFHWTRLCIGTLNACIHMNVECVYAHFVYACMCVCMYVCIHVCVYTHMSCCRVCVYVSMHVCMRCCACVYAPMHVCMLNAQLKRWSGKAGTALREIRVQYVSLDMFGMFRWVSMFRSLCFSKMQATRPRCNLFFCCVVIRESWSKNYYQRLLSGAQEQKL